MSEISIDIATKILPEDHNVFLVRPGSRYKLYPLFVSQNAMFFDLPGLELEKGVQFSDHDDIELRIRRSLALRLWYRSGRIHTTRPSVDLDSYLSSQVSAARRRSVRQLHGIGRGYFERSNKGDLILVPPLAFAADTMIGEVSGEASPDNRISVHSDFYGDDLLYGRKVKWRGGFPKNELSGKIIDLIQKPNAFVLLEKSLRARIYEKAYGNYVLSDRFVTRFETTSEIYDTSSDLKS